MIRFRSCYRHLLTAYYRQKYSKRFASVGPDLVIWGSTQFSGDGRLVAGSNLFIRSLPYKPVDLFVGTDGILRFGDRVFLNQGVRIAATQLVEIGNDCLIGDETVILDNDFHGRGSDSPKSAPVRIGSNVWIATRVIILRGVEIGNHSVIGAGAVVTNSIPPFTFAAGVPARVAGEVRSRY